jgi:hypothetical protein
MHRLRNENVCYSADTIQGAQFWINKDTRLPIRLFLILVFVTTLPAAAPLPAVPIYRSFGRWLVACDHTRACVARGFDEVICAELDLVRDAGVARPTLSLSAEDPIDAVALRLDGKPLAFPAQGWVARDGVLSTSDPAAIDAFIANARDGNMITLDKGPSKDDQPRTVPLNGFTAALLLFDAVQGRLGTAGALIAPRGSARGPFKSGRGRAM